MNSLLTGDIDWWPKALGGKVSYGLSWGTTLLIGLATHHLDLFNLRQRSQSHDPTNNVDWERKSESRKSPRVRLIRYVVRQDVDEGFSVLGNAEFCGDAHACHRLFLKAEAG